MDEDGEELSRRRRGEPPKLSEIQEFGKMFNVPPCHSWFQNANCQILEVILETIQDVCGQKMFGSLGSVSFA